jgi:metallo-beta-lactamase family protein
MNDNKKASIFFYGGVGSVTGANFLVKIDNISFLVDCGLVQGGVDSDQINREKFKYNPKDVNFLFVTHSHMDHIGRIPKLVSEGFNGIIYSTKETMQIAEIMFADALKVMDSKQKSEGLKPLYKESDVIKALSLWKVLDYHNSHNFQNFSVFLKDAGHILGSAMYEFSFTLNGQKRKLVFTGDSGNSPSPLLEDTEKIEDADYLVMDSVYGDRNHEDKKTRDQKFIDIVKRAVDSSFNLIIPAFSIERTQVILYQINNMIEDGLVPSVPVFLDSPLATKITTIYKKSDRFFNRGVKEEIRSGDDIFSFPKLHIVRKAFDSQNIKNITGPKIIIAGSGMSEGGRIVSHEIHFLPDPNSIILLMGYQAVGTLGRKIQDGNKKIVIDGQEIEVKAEIESISGYSSHKDSDGLLSLVFDTKDSLRKVFVVMGEFKSSAFLVQKIKDNLDVNAIVPDKDTEYQID